MHADGGLAVIERALLRWSAGVQRRALPVLLAFLTLTALSLWAAATRLGVDTDTAAMLSAELPWRKAEIDYGRAMPQQKAGIVAVIDRGNGEQRRTAQRQLVQALTGNPLLGSVDAPFSGPFFEKNGLLYLDLPKLDKLADDLNAAQPFLGTMAQDPSLAGLAELLRLMLTQTQMTLPFDLGEVLKPITLSVREAQAGRVAPLSWETLAGGGLAQNGPSFVLIQPKGTPQERPAVEATRAAIAQLPPGVRVRLTGSVPLWMDELAAAGEGAVVSALAALALGAGLLWLGLRSVRLVAMCLGSLLAGLFITAGFAAATIGRLNMISVAFSTLYIGIAIDYGVQLCMRYRELLAQGAGHDDALTRATGGLGSALVVCALTTIAGFFAFIPTDYKGVAELGIIAGCGVIIGLFTSLTMLPAMLQLWAPADAAAEPPAPPGVMATVAGIPMRWPRGVRLGAGVLALACAVLLPRLHFDHNPMHLQPRGTESLSTYEDLVAGDSSPMSVSLLAANAEEAEAVAKKLESLPEVRYAVDLPRLVPGQQEEKMGVLETLQFSVGLNLPEKLELKPVDPTRDLAALKALQEATASKEAASELGKALGEFLADPAAAQNLPLLQQALLGGLPGLMSQLRTALGAEPFTLNDLPPTLQAQWRAADGRYRVDAMPRENLDNDDALLRFVDAVESVAPNATGAPIAYAGGARAVIGAFVQAFTGALVFILALLWLLLRRGGDVLRALAPLLLGSLLLAACSVLAGPQLNFANVIALPLLLGLGVDIGVLILWRARMRSSNDENPVLTGTGAGVLISVLATLASFASLMLSADRGMASIGQLLTLGLLIYLACTFLVLPALLAPVSED